MDVYISCQLPYMEGKKTHRRLLQNVDQCGHKRINKVESRRDGRDHRKESTAVPLEVNVVVEFTKLEDLWTRQC